ncbi:MAG TPA: DUF4142 domain-containing protein [Gemmatimonadaceae bacterium]
MVLRIHSRILIVGASVALLACRADEQRKAPARSPASAAPRDSTRSRADSTFEAAGDVATDTADTAPIGKWLTDANVLALLATINARQITAADIELQAWQSDTVRAFAAWMWREHTAIARGIDSLSMRMKMAPVPSALGASVNASLHAQLDTLRAIRGDPLDRAYVRQQIASHESMASYIAQMGAVAERPELDAFLEATATRVGTQLARAKSVDAILLAKDSLNSSDSTTRAAARAAREARRARRATPTSPDSVPTLLDSLKPPSDSARPPVDSTRPRPDSVRPRPDSVRPRPDSAPPRPGSVPPSPDSVRRPPSSGTPPS